MNKQAKGTFLVAVLCALMGLALTPVQARVVRIQITSKQSPTFAGTSFGTVGKYEKLVGVAYIEVDPKDPHNSEITDLTFAPKNSSGKVEWTTDIFILKPVDMSRGNHKILLDINNRGNMLALSAGFNDATTGGNNPGSAASDAGNGFLFEQGYTVMWAGWEGDLTPGNNLLVNHVPTAKNPDGTPITGKVRQEYSDVAAGTYSLPLSGGLPFISYESVTTDNTQALLTVRTHSSDPRVPVPSNQWAFGTCPTGRASLKPSTSNICYFPGFSPNKLYELIWTAKNPLVMGLGFPATRDVASFFRYSAKDDAGNANPLAGEITYSYVWGESQSGTYIKDFIYQGYNSDEQNRKVFDAAFPFIAAADRVLINTRFAQPNDYSQQDQWHDYLQNAIFPFSWAITMDPITGRTDGILKRPATDPIVFAVNTAEEYHWGRNSLTYINGKGQPFPAPSSVREFQYSGMPHYTLDPTGTTRNICENLLNPNPGVTALNRALLVDLDQWAGEGMLPPDSLIPRGTNLIPPSQFCSQFAKIPNFACTDLVNPLDVLNFGPEFTSIGGIITHQPPIPEPDTNYEQFVPRTDATGNELGGLRSTFVSAPYASYTGWNVRAPGHRQGGLCGLLGSWAPLSKTKAERHSTGDSRPSLQELYGSHAGYVAAVAAQAYKLQSQRFLLHKDVLLVIKQAQDSNILK